MSEITPDLIASIATRLFQGAGTGSGIPSVPEPPGTLPMSSAQIPTSPQIPTSSPQIPMASPFISSGSYPVPGVNSLAPESAVTAGHTAAGSLPFGSIPQAGALGVPTVPEPDSAQHSAVGNEGLRRFVNQLKTSHSSGRDGLCHEDPALQRVFGRIRESSVTSPQARTFDVHAIRRDFPILNQTIHGKQLVWLDNAATTQKPLSVIQTLSTFYSTINSNIHRGAHTLAARSTDAYEQARQKVQQFVGAASAEEIIFVRGTTEGINLIASTWGRKFLQRGDEIVLSVLEHHANIVPWQMIARETGAVIRVIPVNDRGEIQLEEYERILGPSTRLVALTQASNSLGTILPVAEMIRAAKRYNARVLIDGAQSVAHIPVNVQQLDADFFVFSGHKIFGPTGIGAVYAKRELQELMPPWQGGGNMIRNVTFEETTYSDPPARFEAGTPNVADAVGMGAALDYVTRLGLPNIARYEHELLQYATEKLVRIPGLVLIGTAAEKVGVLSFVMKHRSVQEIGKRLDQEGIAVRAGHHCSQPSLRRFGLEATVRPSLSLYNTHEEIDRLADALRTISVR